MVQDLKEKVREQAAEWAGAEKEPGMMEQPEREKNLKNMATVVDREEVNSEDFRNKC